MPRKPKVPKNPLESPTQATSPFPIKSVTVLMDFYSALRETMNGKRITRAEWNDPNIFGYIRDGYLRINLADGYHNWIISDGDLAALDWHVLED